MQDYWRERPFLSASSFSRASAYSARMAKPSRSKTMVISNAINCGMT